jgi:hypothetical protein
MGLFLVVVRAEIVQARVTPPTIIQQLDVLDNCCFSLIPGSKPPPVEVEVKVEGAPPDEVRSQKLE